MTKYFDASVIVASVLLEERTAEARDLISTAEARMTSPLSIVETRRAIRVAHETQNRELLLSRFSLLMGAFSYVGEQSDIWEQAAHVADLTGVKSLDAIHLAAATYLEIDELQFVTFDKKQAIAARSIGLTVVGA
jgi:predicted nucleic acid-binding protein